ncbi:MULTISPECIES: sensor domain-containing diguanylate cyclase [unclassified Mycobacterium]|uniref:GGDEF domain-containing protein n=1 Tax=unclassified Mycobacterium TaxID=2642494 RepID=UPI0009DD7025|nr:MULTISPECIES: sensor domain-containing diguanylate cyclase [unclassified Mycobacterium]
MANNWTSVGDIRSAIAGVVRGAVGGRLVGLRPDNRPPRIDVSERETLRQSEERLALAARVGGLGIWDYDIARDALYCDETWYRIVGRDPADPVRSVTDFRPFIHPDDVDRATEVAHTAAELVELGQDYSIEYRIIRPDGEIRWVRSTACLITDSREVASRAIGFIVDVTDSRRDEMALRHANEALREAQAGLARQILQDPLTGIANRRVLNQELERICLDANRTQHPVTIGMIDVDLFKEFNDRYGHVEGDAALCKIATVLRSSVRRIDTVVRYGGEEFAFVLADGAEPGPILDRLHEALFDLAIPHELSPYGQVTVSCGCVTFYSCDDLTPAMLLRECDEALYEAKEKGRNRNIVRVRRV